MAGGLVAGGCGGGCFGCCRGFLRTSRRPGRARLSASDWHQLSTRAFADVPRVSGGLLALRAPGERWASASPGCCGEGPVGKDSPQSPNQQQKERRLHATALKGRPILGPLHAIATPPLFFEVSLRKFATFRFMRASSSPRALDQAWRASSSSRCWSHPAMGSCRGVVNSPVLGRGST